MRESEEKQSALQHWDRRVFESRRLRSVEDPLAYVQAKKRGLYRWRRPTSHGARDQIPMTLLRTHTSAADLYA